MNVQQLLLSCGIIAPLIYLVTDRLAGKLLKGYSFNAQSMSELSAAGAPTRGLVVALTTVGCVFMVAFGAGVWLAAGGACLPRIVAVLVIANAVFGLVATALFPNRYSERPEFKTPGVVLMFLSVLSFILAMVFGAIAYSGWFRCLSIAIPAAYIILALLRFRTAGKSSSGEAGTMIGAQERTMAYSFLLWVMALAIYL